MYESDEVRFLRRRVIELEKENAKLNAQVSLYLGKWIAAQDLASWRQVQVLANITETTSSDSSKETKK